MSPPHCVDAGQQEWEEVELSLEEAAGQLQKLQEWGQEASGAAAAEEELCGCILVSCAGALRTLRDRASLLRLTLQRHLASHALVESRALLSRWLFARAPFC